MTDYTNDPRWQILMNALVADWDEMANDPSRLLAALDAVDPARIALRNLVHAVDDLVPHNWVSTDYAHKVLGTEPPEAP